MLLLAFMRGSGGIKDGIDRASPRPLSGRVLGYGSNSNKETVSRKEGS